MRKTITVQGQRYSFYLRPLSNDRLGFVVKAEGVVSFPVRNETEARTLLRAVYSR